MPPLGRGGEEYGPPREGGGRAICPPLWRGGEAYGPPREGGGEAYAPPLGDLEGGHPWLLISLFFGVEKYDFESQTRINFA